MERKVYFWEQNKNFLFFSGGLKMRIAICDFDKDFLSHLKRIVYRYAELHRLDIVADCYLSGGERFGPLYQLQYNIFRL